MTLLPNTTNDDERQTMPKKHDWTNLTVGQVVTGTIERITNFGAFVSIDGDEVDALLHKSEMSWDRIDDPSDSFSVGEEITAKVIKIDDTKEHISLSRKQLLKDPWKQVETEFHVGSVVTGTVTSVTDFGCFVSLKEGLTGLVHKSELDWRKSNLNPREVVDKRQRIKVKILQIDPAHKRLSLSIKQCQPNPWRAFAQKHSVGDSVTGTITAISQHNITIELEDDLHGKASFDDIVWPSSEELAQEQRVRAQDASPKVKISALSKNGFNISLQCNASTLLNYLLGLDEPHQLNDALLTLAQGLGLLSNRDYTATQVTSATQLERWLSLVTKLDSVRLQQAFAQTAQGSKRPWYVRLLAHATTAQLLQTCLKLFPRQALTQLSSKDLAALCSKLEQQTPEALAGYSDKLQFLLIQNLQSDLTDQQTCNSVLKLLALNFKLEPKLYFNLTHYGHCTSTSSNTNEREGIIRALSFLLRYDEPKAHQLPALAQLLALLILEQRRNATLVLAWARPWIHDATLRPQLSHELELLLQSSDKHQLLDVTNQDSLELVALLPQTQRFAQYELFASSSLIADLLAPELEPIITSITKVMGASELKDYLGMVGVEDCAEALSSAPLVKWQYDSEDQIAQANRALALCYVLNTPSFKDQYNNLYTALLVNTPDELATACLQLEVPELARVLSHLESRLTTSPKRPWNTPLAMMLVHKVGASIKRLPEKLSHYLVLGPNALASSFASVAPIAPLSTWTTQQATNSTEELQTNANACLDALRALVTGRISAGQCAPLTLSDLNQAADSEPWEQRYFAYGAIDSIKEAAPTLYDFLCLHLKGAPTLLALSALPSQVKSLLGNLLSPQDTASKTCCAILGSEDLKAFSTLVVTTSELQGANYPVTYWGNINDLRAIAPEQLTSFSVLMVGQSPQVLLENLAPQPLALKVKPHFYNEHGYDNLCLCLAFNTNAEQLSVISPELSAQLLLAHRDIAKSTTEQQSKLVATDAASSPAASSDQTEELQPSSAQPEGLNPNGAHNEETQRNEANLPEEMQPTGQVIVSRNLDNTFDLYTLKLDVNQHLAAFTSCDCLSLQSWPQSALTAAHGAPLKICLVSTLPELCHRQSTYSPIKDELAAEVSLGGRDAIEKRYTYGSKQRARYFAYQVHLLNQVSADSDSSTICYLIEYERDIAPLRAYLQHNWPQLAERVHLISLSALLPQSLCSDLAEHQAANEADQSLAKLQPDSVIIINSLELSAHQTLSTLSEGFGDKGYSVRHTLMELGLSALAAQLPDEELESLTSLLQERSMYDEQAKQAQSLMLLQGLLVLLYYKLGTVAPSCSYYLLEPQLNDGVAPDLLDLFVTSFTIELRHLIPFDNQPAEKRTAENKDAPYFSSTSEATGAALAALDDIYQDLTEQAPNNKPDEALDEAQGSLQNGSQEAIEAVHEPSANGTASDREPARDSNDTPERWIEQFYDSTQEAETLERLSSDDERISKLELSKALNVISFMFIDGHKWRPYQLAALPTILKHQNDCLISLPTGGGKSVLFQGPAWYRSFFSGHLSIVITPLKALMLDQVLALRDKGLKNADYLSSDRPYHEIRQVMERLSSGDITLLYVTPERLRSRYFMRTLCNRYAQDNNQGEYFIFDEAHCISQWGKEFRPDYIYAAKMIAKLRQTYDFSVIMCSATMTDQVIHDLTKYLRPDYKLLGEIGTNYNPIRPHIGLFTQLVPPTPKIPNLTYYEQKTYQLVQRAAAIIDFIRDNKVDFSKSRVLVFCQTRKRTEELSLALASYATYLRRLYQCTSQHPNTALVPISLTDLLFQLDSQGTLEAEDGYEGQYEAQPDSVSQESSTQESSAQDSFSTMSSWEQRLDANLNSDQAAGTPQLDPSRHYYCDVTDIDPNDPILQLSQHVGFFHAGMHVRAREHTFNRFKESSAQTIAAFSKNKQTESWFNESEELSTASTTEHDRNLTANFQPIFVLCATKAFGMGMDLPNIHYVIHERPSAVFEDYLQEVGRAGRSEEMYQAAFPLDPATGQRAQLPAVCLYNSEDFERTKELLNLSLLSWEGDIKPADDLVRAYVACFGELRTALQQPVVVPQDLFNRSIINVLDPLPQSDDQNSTKNALLFFYLEDLGRIQLTYRAPCTLLLTLKRSAFQKFKQAPLDPAPRSTQYDIDTQDLVIEELTELLQRYDAQTPAQQSLAPDATDYDRVKADDEVVLLFGLNEFLLRPYTSTNSTLNALIELMAAGVLKLRLPFYLGTGKNTNKQKEVSYYFDKLSDPSSKKLHTIPAFNQPSLPLLTITLQVCSLILEQSYQDFCGEVKRYQERLSKQRSAQAPVNNKAVKLSTRNGPLPYYHGIAISNEWIKDKVLKLLEPLVLELGQEDGANNVAIPWLSTYTYGVNSSTKKTYRLDNYIDRILLPTVKRGINVLLRQLPDIKVTKKSASVCLVKTWSDSFYLMLDLLYEDSWRVLNEIYADNHNPQQTAPKITIDSISQQRQTQPAASPSPHSAYQAEAARSSLNDWGLLVFNLGLRHESCQAVLDNYELYHSRRDAPRLYQELASKLDTYNYVTNLLSFLKTLGLIVHTPLVLYGFELTLTQESVEQPLEAGIEPSSTFYQRRKQFETLTQFKRTRLGIMQTYCQELPDNQRRRFIEEFFKISDNEDYIKHIIAYAGEDSDLLNELRASRLELEEDKLRSNSDQWQVYQSPLNQSLNVMAGPGSGKTHVLALRCVRMVYREHVQPESMLVLAYNRAVVVELKARIDQIFTNLGLRKVGRKVPIFTFHSLARLCLGAKLKDIATEEWEYTFIARLRETPELFTKHFAALRYIMIDEFQDITHARLELLNFIHQQYPLLTIFTIGDINQSIYGFSRIDNMLHDPEQQALLTDGRITAEQYAACLGPAPYYSKLNELFNPTTLSLQLNYRSFPKILQRAKQFACNEQYLSYSAPLLCDYAPADRKSYSTIVAASEQAAHYLQMPVRRWDKQLTGILSFVKERNAQAEQKEQEIALHLSLADREAVEHYVNKLIAAKSLQAKMLASDQTESGTESDDVTPEDSASDTATEVKEASQSAGKKLSEDETLLRCHYSKVKSIALFFRTNNEVYRALEQIRAMPQEALSQVELHIQGSSNTELWREREFYAIAHFIQEMGDQQLNLSDTLLQAPPTDDAELPAQLLQLNAQELNLPALYQSIMPIADKEPQRALKLLTQSLMRLYPNWDQVKLDMAYCLALSFSSTMTSEQIYTWADLNEYFLELLARDDGGQCYKLYDSMWRYHMDTTHHQNISLTLTTMHKVKGLEYDMVLIPPSTCNLPLINHNYIRSTNQQERFDRNRCADYAQAQWVAQNLPLTADEQADIEEERRLYYVAYTRARKFLCAYYGDREMALALKRRYVAPEELSLWSEKDDSIDNYVISFNANQEQIGCDNYIAQCVQRNDPVLIVRRGSVCLIKHNAYTIGMLSSNSALKRQMRDNNVMCLEGLFISDILVWTYQDTINSDIRQIQEAWTQQASMQHNTSMPTMPDLHNPSVRNDVAQQLRVHLYEPYWCPTARTKGYCYLVTLAGRGTPH